MREKKSFWTGIGMLALTIILLLSGGSLWSRVPSPGLKSTPEGPSPEGRGDTGYSCGNPSAVSCCGGKAQLEENKMERVKRHIYSLYAKKLNDRAITVEVQDLGCHMEAQVLKEGKMVKRLSVSGESVTEIE